MQHRARKRFGQHFLHDSQVLDRIIGAFRPVEGQHIIEIGPGQGALTNRLLRMVPHIDAIEIDRDLVRSLSLRYTEDQLTLIERDILNVNLTELAQSPASLRLIGNLPYNISTPLIFHLLNHLDVIEDMVFMVQKEVAKRLCASPGSKAYGRLTVMTGVLLQTRQLFDVAPSSFSPPPRVDSSVIQLRPLDNPAQISDHKQYSKLVAAAFNQRRKTIKNALKGLVGGGQLEAAGIDPGARAESVAIEQYVRLANLLAS